MEKNSLLSFFEVLSSKIKCCLLPKNIVSTLVFLKLEDRTSIHFQARSGKIKNGLFHYSMIVMLCFSGLFMNTKILAQTSPSQPSDCKTGCTSNDVQIQRAYLVDLNGVELSSSFTCQGTTSVRLALDLTTKTPRIGVVVYANIKSFIGGVVGANPLTTVKECFGSPLNQPSNKVVFSQPFGWACGTPIVLTDVFIGWGTGNTNFCTGAGFQCPATSSKCYSLPPGNYITIQIPTANSTSATKCSTTILEEAPAATFNLTDLETAVKGSQTNVTVSWFLDIGLGSPISSPSSFITGTRDVWAKVTSTIDTSVYTSSKITLTVNQTPNLTITNPAAVCSPSTVDLTAAAVTSGSILPAGTSLSYWTNADATAALSSPSAVSTSGTYYIKATTNTTPACSDIKAVTVTVNPKPNLAITNPAAVCSPSTVNITAAAVTSGSVLEGGSLSYWTNSAATSSLASPGAVTTSGTYYIKVTTTAGCTDIKSVLVTINTKPTAGAGADFTKTCSTNINGKQIGEDNNNDFTYSWNPSTGLSNSEISNPVANPSTTTDYTVTKTNKTTGCSGTDSVTVTVNTDAPNAPTFCAVQPSLCGSAGSVTILTPDSGTGYEYSIDNGLNWQSSTVFSPLAAGSVTGIKVKNTNTGCVSSPADCGASNCQSSAKIANPDTKTTSKIAPVEETPVTSKTETAGFEAYPVPFKNQLTIKYKFSYVSDVIIEVFNTNGSMVHSKADTNSYFDKEITLNYNFNTGTQQVYIVKLTTKFGHSERKVISSY